MRFANLLFRLPLLASLLLFSHVVAAQETILQIQVLGHFYEAVVSENTALNEKISNAAAIENVTHYAGVIKNIDQSWVRVSNINGQWQGVVSLFGTMHVIQQGVSVKEGTASSSYGLLYSLPIESTGDFSGTCGSGDESHSMLDPIPALTAQNEGDDGAGPPALSATFAEFCAQQVDGVCVLAEVEIAFDQPFQAAFGALASAQALAILNIVDGHYLNDLNISIDAITVAMLADDLFDTSVAASPVLNAGILLDNIETKKNNNEIPFITNNSALTHVVTGRDFAGNTLGVAYLGSVCEANGFSTGTSSIYYDGAVPNVALTAMVVAHELGHNLGSDHDGPGANAACPVNTFIMSPGLGPGITNFSSCSITDIQNRLSILPTPEQCLDFPADVAVAEDAGNNGTLNASQEFTSAYTVTIANGFQAVNQLLIDGSINLTEGNFVGVTANGNACTVAVDGASYTCVVLNPGASVALRTQVKVNNNIMNVSITQTANEQTDDVQDINTANNVLTTVFAIMGNDVVTNNPNVPNTPAPNTPNNITVGNSDSGGGGGSGSPDFYLLLMLLLLYSVTHNKIRLYR